MQIKCIAYQKVNIFLKYFKLEAIILKTKSADINHLVWLMHGVRHGFKIWGRAKTIIELESEPKFNINLYKII